jgi:hypothetical protein
VQWRIASNVREEKKKLTVDGVVGPQTRTALVAAD